MPDRIRPAPAGGRRFGWLTIALLTSLWAVWLWLRLRAFFLPDTFYHRLSALLPGVLPAAGWTLTFVVAAVWGGLAWRSWQRRRAPVPVLDQEGLLALSPRQFEKYVALIFRHKGFQVRHRGRSGDHGVDLEVVSSLGRLGIVQCKRYRSTVGEKVVRDLFGTMAHEGAAHAFLVTAGNISESARVWAAGKPITLVDGARLISLARSLNR
jgi:restriction system protein